MGAERHSVDLSATATKLTEKNFISRENSLWKICNSKPSNIELTFRDFSNGALKLVFFLIMHVMLMSFLLAYHAHNCQNFIPTVPIIPTVKIFSTALLLLIIKLVHAYFRKNQG